jgi:hypothetical protein
MITLKVVPILFYAFVFHHNVARVGQVNNKVVKILLYIMSDISLDFDQYAGLCNETRSSII